jgi:hypothetical protein
MPARPRARETAGKPRHEKGATRERADGRGPGVVPRLQRGRTSRRLSAPASPMTRGLREPLARGISHPAGVARAGLQQHVLGTRDRRGLAQRLAQDEPEIDPYTWPQPGAERRRVGGSRSGRVAAYDVGLDEPIAERGADEEDGPGPRSSAPGEDPYWGPQVGTGRGDDSCFTTKAPVRTRRRTSSRSTSASTEQAPAPRKPRCTRSWTSRPL